MKDLEEKGVKVIGTREELEALKEGIVVIRSGAYPGNPALRYPLL